MRRSFFIVALTGLLTTAAVPAAATAAPTEDRDPEATSPAPVAVQRVSGFGSGMRDEAAMVLIGTLLIGLGTAVRRTA